MCGELENPAQYRASTLVAMALIAMHFLMSEPVLYFMRGLFGCFGRMQNIGNRTLLRVCQRRRIVREIATECAHISNVGQGWPANLTHHVNGMRPLNHHFHERCRHHVVDKPLADFGAYFFWICGAEILQRIELVLLIRRKRLPAESLDPSRILRIVIVNFFKRWLEHLERDNFQIALFKSLDDFTD